MRGQFGFVTALGPQAYHIIRSSLLTVLLLDPLQGFRQRENTSIEDLREWSRELGAGDPEEISLEGMQFRCAGSAEFVTWIESFLSDRGAGRTQPREAGVTAAETVRRYRITAHAAGAPPVPAEMDIRIFDDPEQLEAALRQRHAEGSSVRLLSTYSRKWKTETAANPHALPAELMDFHERYEVSGQTRYWSRIWNFVPRGDYTWYVTGHPAGLIAGDPLAEVGCPYAVRGFDYDYVGILWLNDLLWRRGRWRVDPNAVEESGMMSLARAARREARTTGDGHATSELLYRVAQAYRILFTRALKGAYVWIPDQETRDHFASRLQ